MTLVEAVSATTYARIYSRHTGSAGLSPRVVNLINVVGAG